MTCETCYLLMVSTGFCAVVALVFMALFARRSRELDVLRCRHKALAERLNAEAALSNKSAEDVARLYCKLTEQERTISELRKRAMISEGGVHFPFTFESWRN